MADLLKKLLYTSVGLISISSERVQQLTSDLVEQSKISEEEGKKIVEEFVENTESKREEFETKLTKLVEDIVETFDFPRNGDFLDLNSRISAIESKLGIEQDVVAEATATVETAKPKASKKPTKKNKG